MKTCHIIPCYYSHYAAPYEYSRRLARMGLDVDVLAYSRPDEPASEVIDGVHVKRVPSVEHEHFSPKDAYIFLSELLRWLDKRYYDLIHVYAFRGCNLLPRLRRNRTAHWLLDIRTGNVSANRVRSRLANQVTRIESRVYDTCIAVDQHVGNRVLGPEQRFHVVPIGVDTEKFQPNRHLDLRRQLGIADDRLVVVFNSSLVRPRMPERVIQAFAQARRQCLQLSLLIIGDGTKGIIDELRMLAGSLQVAEDVFFTGYVSYGTVQHYITAGDIGLAYVPIIPQFDSQPPLKTAEFLACGLPTLATHTLGNTVWIRDNENGLLIRDDPESITEGIIRLACDPALRAQLAGAARPSILQHDWSRIVSERLLPVYTQALEM